jgi:hypothetical protein
MTQVHTFSNPFLNHKQEKNTSHQDDSAFSNYKTMPWLHGAQMGGHWFESGQKFWQEYWEWASWQQQIMQQNIQDGSRLMMHCMQLSANPQKLARYMRMNWQKPYLTLNAQALTSSRLLTKMMTDCMSTVQKHEEKKH